MEKHIRDCSTSEGSETSPRLSHETNADNLATQRNASGELCNDRCPRSHKLGAGFQQAKVTGSTSKKNSKSITKKPKSGPTPLRPDFDAGKSVHPHLFQTKEMFAPL